MFKISKHKTWKGNLVICWTLRGPNVKFAEPLPRKTVFVCLSFKCQLIIPQYFFLFIEIFLVWDPIMRPLRKGRRLKIWCIPIFRRATPWEWSLPHWSVWYRLYHTYVFSHWYVTHIYLPHYSWWHLCLPHWSVSHLCLPHWSVSHLCLPQWSVSHLCTHHTHDIFNIPQWQNCTTQVCTTTTKLYRRADSPLYQRERFSVVGGVIDCEICFGNLSRSRRLSLEIQKNFPYFTAY